MGTYQIETWFILILDLIISKRESNGFGPPILRETAWRLERSRRAIRWRDFASGQPLGLENGDRNTIEINKIPQVWIYGTKPNKGWKRDFYMISLLNISKYDHFKGFIIFHHHDFHCQDLNIKGFQLLGVKRLATGDCGTALNVPWWENGIVAAGSGNTIVVEMHVGRIYCIMYQYMISRNAITALLCQKAIFPMLRRNFRSDIVIFVWGYAIFTGMCGPRWGSKEKMCTWIGTKSWNLRKKSSNVDVVTPKHYGIISQH